MNNNAWFKKEKPLLSLQSMGGGASGTLMQGASDKTYVDEVFSTYTDIGTGSARTIVNNIDLADKGGLVWQKWRSGGASANVNNTSHILADTVRGTSNYLKANTTDTEFSTSAVGSFNSNGYQTGGNLTSTDNSNDKYASWTFAKQEGFFDVVTYTGNGSNRTIAHSLSCIPGMIFVKSRDDAEWWAVYHRQLNSGTNPEQYYLRLNDTNGEASSADLWNNTAPTSTHFSLGTGNAVNKSGDNYVAYVSAGGESDAATARGVRFDGSDDYLSLAASSDFDMGTGDFTIECWLNRDDTSNNSAWTLASYDNGMELYCYDDNSLRVYGNNGAGASWLIQSAANVISPGTWHHVAVVRDSGTLKLFQNGTLLGSTAHSSAMPNNGETTDFFIGVEINSSNSIPATNPYFDGEISNFRVVKGTAVYTSSFRPPYEPLTNITNTKLLCCNDSSVTGSTVTPGTITAHSSPTATTNSPFDDPEVFKFGGNSDREIIKCGSYIGNGSSTGPDIKLGWEPQFIIVKQSSDSGNNWRLWDSMRGIATGGEDETLYPSSAAGGDSVSDRLDLTSTGFKITRNDSAYNGDGSTYVYIAIRRPDGWVGKAPEAGTDAFAMDTGASSSTIPNFDSNFPVDFTFSKVVAGAGGWYTNARLIQGKELYTDTTAGAVAESSATFDSNVGWSSYAYNSLVQSWMFKRGPGFDVVTYDGISAQRKIQHSLGQAAEMLWIKRTDGGSDEWTVGHGALDSGGWNKFLKLNTYDAEAAAYGTFDSTAPTATHFSLSTSSRANYDGQKYIAMLFASVSGISKVGSYTGNGGSSTNTITTGFQPRFIFIKGVAHSSSWGVHDTVRGWGTASGPYLRFNNDNAEVDIDIGAPISTGFTLTTSHSSYNGNGYTYIYYAHA